MTTRRRTTINHSLPPRWGIGLFVLSLLLGFREPADGQEAAGRPLIVRDRLWVWAHEAGVYNGHWGLPESSRMTPVEGATYLGLANLIFIRYEGKPTPPYAQYAIPFRPLHRVFWSITGASGATSRAEREEVFRLAAANPNITGVFMDDFFDLGAEPVGPRQWLAKNDPTFPVVLTVSLTNLTPLTRLELRQTDWTTGDYRSRTVAVDLSIDGTRWTEAGTHILPDRAGANSSVSLPGTPSQSLRLRFLDTYDRRPHDAHSCGLQGLRLWAGDREVELMSAKLQANSSFAGHEPVMLLPIAENRLSAAPAPAALSVAELQEVRQRLQLPGRRLDLGVTLYTHQLTPRVQNHLELCDVVSLWTWKSEDLERLEANFARLRELMPKKRVLLGCYLYDFGNNRTLPLDRMKHQCNLALRWLQDGRIEGIIFLGTNVCDLNLEAVEWTRSWIAQVGSQALRDSR